MSLVIPLHARLAFNARVVADEPVILLTITDSTLTTPLRMCSFPVERLSAFDAAVKYGVRQYPDKPNEVRYTYAIMGSLPADQEGGSLVVTLVVDNVDQEFTEALIALTVDNACQIDLVLASEPETLIRSFPAMMITNVDCDDVNITLKLERNRQILASW